MTPVAPSTAGFAAAWSVGRAVVRTAQERGLVTSKAETFKAIPGYGVEATVEGRPLLVGGPTLLQRLGAEMSPELAAFAAEAAERGQSVIHLVEGRRILAALTLADAVRPESREAVTRLHELGLEVVMMTGDAKPVADAVARELGIEHPGYSARCRRAGIIWDRAVAGGRCGADVAEHGGCGDQRPATSACKVMRSLVLIARVCRS
jgi:phosphoglycolate phosphatase-like HAD superfamily hydrolase